MKLNEMKTWLLEEESGQGMVEYGLIIVLIALAVVAVLGNVGSALKSKFGDINSQLTGNTTP